MIDFNNMHQIRLPVSRISTLLVVLISFLLVLLTFATCVMFITYFRRKLKKNVANSLFCRSETSETLIESSLINNEQPTMYSAIDV